MSFAERGRRLVREVPEGVTICIVSKIGFKKESKKRKKTMEQRREEKSVRAGEIFLPSLRSFLSFCGPKVQFLFS
jgi:hypothetical protein